MSAITINQRAKGFDAGLRSPSWFWSYYVWCMRVKCSASNELLKQERWLPQWTVIS